MEKTFGTIKITDMETNESITEHVWIVEEVEENMAYLYPTIDFDDKNPDSCFFFFVEDFKAFNNFEKVNDSDINWIEKTKEINK